MPLLLPGLDEAKFKTLAKQLHKGLQHRPEPLSLTQMQDVLAQALGYPHRHAALQQYQQPQGPRDTPASTSHLTEAACLALRDHLWAQAWFPSSQTRMFCFLAVTPGGYGEAAATIHFAFQRATWTQQAPDPSPERALELLLDASPWAQTLLTLDYHDHLRHPWPVDWAITLKEEHRAWPTLVVQETIQGAVDGVLMWDTLMDQTEAALANVAAEPLDVQMLLRGLKHLPPDADAQSFHPLLGRGWIKAANVQAPHLLQLFEQAPLKQQGRAQVLVYRHADEEWLSGQFDREGTTDEFLAPQPSLTWHSVADAHATRVSVRKRQSRGSLDVVRQAQTIQGDWTALRQALKQVTTQDLHAADLEQVPAVRTVCDWWHDHAPAGMRHAEVFKVYQWIPEAQIFRPFDRDEPARDAHSFAEVPSFALFERAGLPTVAVVFGRGRAHHRRGGPYGAQTFYANGAVAWNIGCDVTELNEARYAVEALLALAAGRRVRVTQAGTKAAHSLDGADERAQDGSGC